MASDREKLEEETLEQLADRIRMGRRAAVTITPLPPN